MNRHIIDISNDFSFSYEKVPLLHLNLESDGLYFERGKIYGIFGENGSGKTTFLNLINGFLNPSTGTISYSFKNFNYTNTTDSNHRNNISEFISNNIRRCFQVPFLVDELSIIDNIDIARRLYEKETFINTFSFHNKKQQNQDIIELLDLVNLKGNDLAETLSYGQRRIVSNLQALFSHPELIILDEPFSNLHFNIIEKLKKLYFNKVKAFGATIIIVEHTPQNIKGFADEIVLIKEKLIFKQK